MGHPGFIPYTKERWDLLKGLRAKASTVMLILKENGFESLVHGSLARGDVTPGSDIDIVIPQVMGSFKLELALDGIGIIGRKLVQATPGSVIKAHIHLPDNIMVTFPMVQPSSRELGFYAFGGQLGTEKLDDVHNNRVPGVDKRLMLIEPVQEGHNEMPLSDLSPGVIARRLGVGQDIVTERIRVLSRRAKVGITGVYLDRSLGPDEGFEAVLETIAAADSLVRRRLKKR